MDQFDDWQDMSWDVSKKSSLPKLPKKSKATNDNLDEQEEEVKKLLKGVSKTGNLLVKESARSWTPCIVSVAAGILSYSIGGKEVDSFVLYETSLREYSEEGSPYCFVIVASDRSVIFKAKSSKAQTKWLKLLIKHKVVTLEAQNARERAFSGSQLFRESRENKESEAETTKVEQVEQLESSKPNFPKETQTWKEGEPAVHKPKAAPDILASKRVPEIKIPTSAEVPEVKITKERHDVKPLEAKPPIEAPAERQLLTGPAKVGITGRKAPTKNVIRERAIIETKSEEHRKAVGEDKEKSKAHTAVQAAKQAQIGGYGLLYNLDADLAFFQKKSSKVTASKSLIEIQPAPRVEEYDPNKPRLIQIKGRRNIFVRQVAVQASSLNVGDVFLLDAGKSTGVIYQWNGPQANRFLVNILNLTGQQN